MPRVRVLVIGDTLDGWIAATILHCSRYEVELFARTDHEDAIDTYVHLTPNATGALDRVGICIDQGLTCNVDKFTEYSPRMEVIEQFSMEGTRELWWRPWMLIPKSKLLRLLQRQLSLVTQGQGRVTIHDPRLIKNIDTRHVTVTTQDGTELSANFLVAADGTDSFLKNDVGRVTMSPSCTPKYVRRFQIRKDSLLLATDTADSLSDLPGIVAINYSDSRMIILPTPDSKVKDILYVSSHSSSHGVGQKEIDSRSEEPYISGEVTMGQLIKLAEPGTISKMDLNLKSRTLLRQGEHCALVGAAACPTVPVLGVEPSQAIEDAVTLAIVMKHCEPTVKVLDSLNIYRSIREARRAQIQEFSQKISSSLRQSTVDLSGHLTSLFSHNAYDYAVQCLRSYGWSVHDGAYWRMPIEFGPMPGPRQSHALRPFSSQHSTFVSASIRFKTSRSMLENLFPPNRAGFRFRSPGTVAYASFAQHTFSNLDWLGGRGYRLLGFYIHGVDYVQSGGNVLRGTHVPVLFESLGDPILSGREELGMPKLYTEISVDRRPKSHRVIASWEGSIWGSFDWTGLDEIPLPDESNAGKGEEDGLFCYKYIPGVGRQSTQSPDADYPILVPARDESCKPRIKRMWRAANATITLDERDWEALPTMHHIIHRLQELPIYEIVDAKIVEGEGVASASQTSIMR